MKFTQYLLTGLLLASTTVRAEFITGVDLNKWCASQDPSDKAACLAYVLGVNDTMDKLSSGKKTKLYCLPKENFSSGQLYEIIVQFLHENPRYAHQSAAVNTLVALQRKYPCQ